jgi:predicted exporter
MWDTNLMNLSPIPPAAQALNTRLQHDLGVQATRYFVVFRAADEQDALRKSEVLGRVLQKLVAQRQLGGFNVPSAILPSNKAQRFRQAALPNGHTLKRHLVEATVGLPFRPRIFVPFFHDVEQERTTPLLTRADLPPTLALQLQSMLIFRGHSWDVIAPLHHVRRPTAVALSIRAAMMPGADFVDLNHESNQLLRKFEREATDLAFFGGSAILAVLLMGLRSPQRVATVVTPLVAAVIVTASLLTINGGKLSIFMVFGFLLIVAVGSNYCLFFERSENDAATQQRSFASIVLANLCTVSAYGLMAASGIPVLHDIGMTVAIGAFLSMLFAAILSPYNRAVQP